jgi:UTP--glucose-1-phosphate uridylyltransferase
MGFVIKTAVIPVAGLGMRFAPVTRVVPKAMLPVLCKPMLHYVIEEGLQAGIEEFIFVIASHMDMFREYLESVEDKRFRKARVHFILQDHPLGLGHAVWLARDYIHDDHFAVLLPDEIFAVKSGAGLLGQMVDKMSDSKASCVHQRGANVDGVDGVDGVVAVLDVAQENICKYGVINRPNAAEGVRSKYYSLTDVIEKPSLDSALSNIVIIGRYIFPVCIFSSLEQLVSEQMLKIGNVQKNNLHNKSCANTQSVNNVCGQKSHKESFEEIDLTSSMLRMVNEGRKLYAFKPEGVRLDCGNALGLIEANLFFGLQDPELCDDIKKMLKRFVDSS